MSNGLGCNYETARKRLEQESFYKPKSKEVEDETSSTAPSTTPSAPPASKSGSLFVFEAADAVFGEVGSNNECDDGKDDGDISPLSIFTNICQGVIRSVPNMVKSAFTDSEGKFSLSKTLLTVGTGALCIAFPAVGLGLSALGIASGAVSIFKNTKALATHSFDNDADAKAAAEELGSNIFTTALSAMGTKASYNAMEVSSSACLGNMKGNNSWIDTIKENGILKVGQALAEDAKTSTINNFKTIKTELFSKVAQIPSKLKQIAQEEKGIRAKQQNLKARLKTAKQDLKNYKKTGNELRQAVTKQGISVLKDNIKANSAFGRLTTKTKAFIVNNKEIAYQLDKNQIATLATRASNFARTNLVPLAKEFGYSETEALQMITSLLANNI